MIDNLSYVNLENAVSSELSAAIRDHGEFNSYHEAYAVLREENEEVAEAFTVFTNRKKDVMQDLWKEIRRDDTAEMKGALITLRNAAIDIAKECVQVAAVCDKWDFLIKKEKQHE